MHLIPQHTLRILRSGSEPQGKRREAHSPIGEMLEFFRVLNLSVRRAFDHDAFAVAKAAAYSSILTLFPALLVLGAVLASSRRFELYVGEITDALGWILPTGSATAAAYVRSKAIHPVDFLIATSLLTIWTASSAIVSWMEGFRNAYQLPRTWGLIKERLVASSLVILAGIPLMFATVSIAFGGQIENRLVPYVGHGWDPLILLAWTGIRWLIASVTCVGVIALIYHNAVPRTQRWHTVLPGAITASALWFGATLLFGWYLRQSTEYSVIYGVLGVGIALLVWMYVVSLIVLVGAEFNAVRFPRSVAHRRAA
ncbi:MAG TPA: YihY/virulence factor BrkB family protein [Candidatus Acidoferrales bacterium]|nr:YihY/virulence factor BrkB family protein [Candidatus Acidoferrales bacterium]